MALKTNYKDDVPDESVNVNRKFNMIDNGDGTVSFEDATEYEQVGDNFGALDVNAITKTLTDETANVSFNFGIDGNGNYGYIKEGETAVTPFQTRHTETYKPTSRANNLDMGLYHKKRYVDTTAVPNANSGTYRPTQRKNNNDMGATNTYRYVDTTAVPNSNSQTYSVTSNGTKDMGETNIYRYLSVDIHPDPSFGLITGGPISAATNVNISGYRRYIVVVGAYGADSNFGTVSGCGATLIGRTGITYNTTAVYYCTTAGTITVTPNSQRATYIVVGVNT